MIGTVIGLIAVALMCVIFVTMRHHEDIRSLERDRHNRRVWVAQLSAMIDRETRREQAKRGEHLQVVRKEYGKNPRIKN
jgi:hypothetical protein